MLVIRRKAGESLVVGNNIRITVLETRSGSVRLGVEAPADVSVIRSEILDAIEQANREASESQPEPDVVSQLPHSDVEAGEPKQPEE